jgi:hypothetical protein
LWRPSSELLVGVQRLSITKWFVPGGVEVAGDGGSTPVEKSKDWIAFLQFGLGSLAQKFRTVL